jgi:hypothetical protein
MLVGAGGGGVDFRGVIVGEEEEVFDMLCMIVISQLEVNSR